MKSSRSILGRIQLRVATSVASRRARSTSLKLAKALKFRKVLVICYGNIYRSPFVAACLRKGLDGVVDCEIHSAGFHEPGGRPTPADFVSIARARAGIDLEAHRSRILTANDIAWADVILIMDRLNWHRLAMLDCDCFPKVIWLSAFGSTAPCDIPDPYGQPEQAVERILDRLLEATTGLVGHISAMQNIG